jgi:excisionase family DNA binding protein
MCPNQELASLREADVARLLGVTRRMIRKYVRSRGLPHLGEGRSRRFDWRAVLEWYLLYRVSIVDRGGQQRSTLRQYLGSVRKRATERERTQAAGRYRRQVERKRVNQFRAGLRLREVPLDKATSKRRRRSVGK